MAKAITWVSVLQRSKYFKAIFVSVTLQIIHNNYAVLFVQVERGYRVRLDCDTLNAEIFYTTNGSYPVDYNTDVLVINLLLLSFVDLA